MKRLAILAVLTVAVLGAFLARGDSTTRGATNPRYDPAETTAKPVLEYRRFLQPKQKLELCVNSGGLIGGGDGGVGIMSPVDGTRYHMEASGDLCWTTDNAITKCSATEAVAPNGMRLVSGVPIENSFSGAGTLPDSGVAAAPIVYVRCVSGSCCLVLAPLLPR